MYSEDEFYYQGKRIFRIGGMMLDKKTELDDHVFWIEFFFNTKLDEEYLEPIRKFHLDSAALRILFNKELDGFLKDRGYKILPQTPQTIKKEDMKFFIENFVKTGNPNLQTQPSPHGQEPSDRIDRTSSSPSVSDLGGNAKSKLKQ